MHCANRCMHFVQVEKRFKDEQIHAPITERLGLLSKNRSGLIDRHFAPRLDANSEWTDCACDEDILACSLMRDPGALYVDLSRLLCEAMLHQFCSIRTEGVGFNDVDSGFHVVGMHFADEMRLRQVQLIEAPADEDAFGVEHRAHSAITDEDAGIKLIQKVGHTGRIATKSTKGSKSLCEFCAFLWLYNFLMKEIVIVAGKRTPMAEYGGVLRDYSALDLGSIAAKAAIEQSGFQQAEFEHSIFGNALQTSGDALYGARHVALKAGLPVEVPALTVNRLCGSGIQSIVSAAQLIELSEASVVLAGGMESMSQAPHVIRGTRWGLRLGQGKLEDSLMVALLDTYCGCYMAATAETLAR